MRFFNVILFIMLHTGTVRRFLEKFGDSLDTVIFVVTGEDEVRCYSSEITFKAFQNKIKNPIVFVNK